MHQIILHLGKKLIHHIIMPDHLIRGPAVTVYKSTYRIMHDFLSHLQHTRNMPGISIQITIPQTKHQLRNIRSLIPNPLNIRYYLQGGGYHPQIPCNRLLPGNQGKTLGFNASFHIIDHPISPDNLLLQICILIFHRSQQQIKGLLHCRPHFRQAFPQAV